MKKLKLDPLDLLCTPRPLNYKFITVKKDIAGTVHTYTDFSQQKKCVEEQTKRKVKRRFEKEVYECWEKANNQKNELEDQTEVVNNFSNQRYLVENKNSDIAQNTKTSQENIEQNRILEEFGQHSEEDKAQNKQAKGIEDHPQNEISHFVEQKKIPGLKNISINSYRESVFSVEKDRRFKQKKREISQNNVEETGPLFSEEYFEHFGQPVEYVTWENEIVYDAEAQYNENTGDSSGIIKDGSTFQFINTIFNITPWEQSIVYDNVKNFRTTTELWINDPNLIFSPIIHEKKENSYNISLDKYYTPIKKAKETLGIVHSLIGNKMIWNKAISFFDKMFKKEMHKSIDEKNNLRMNGMIKKGNQDKNEKIQNKNREWVDFRVKDIKPAIQTITTLEDHTLTDTNKFVIMEYAEEEPMIKQETGMGSFLVHYTIMDEKSTENSNHLPDESLFVTVPVTDEPFCLKLRENTSSIVNNLFKARVYTHKSKYFLLIIKNNNVYIRKINNLITVGQTFPSEEVFSPHSRKMNLFCKNRLKQFCFRYANNQKKDKLNSHRADSLVPSKAIDDYFPLFTEGSKKKWLKEYSEPVRENGIIFHKLKFFLDESDVDNLVTPEQACLYDSMVNYQKNTFGDPPWTISKNYIQFKKKSLSIEVKNDYTGIGEGISFRQGEESEISYDLWDREKNSLTKTDISDTENFDAILQKSSQCNIQQIDNQKNLVKSNLEIEAETPSQTDSEDHRPHILITRILDGEKTIEKITNLDVINLYLRSKNKEKDSSVEESGQKKKNRAATNISVLRCGACNGVGHMKTNKTCPKFISRKKIVNKKAKNMLNNMISQVISRCLHLNFSNAFVKPVSIKKFPDYPKIVKQPIDLGVMRSRSKTYSYKKYDHFVEDITLMWKNCCIYNGESHGLSVLSGKMVNLANETKQEKNTEIEELETLIREQEEDMMAKKSNIEGESHSNISNEIYVSQNEKSDTIHHNKEENDPDEDFELDRELDEEFNNQN